MPSGLAALLLCGVASTALADALLVDRLIAAAVEQTRASVRYDGSYRRISYPNGDVPAEIGVCTDVVIRAYRKVGIDLQQRVHEDMLFDYPITGHYRYPEVR